MFVFFLIPNFLKVRFVFVSAPLAVFNRFVELLGPLASLALHSDKARGKVVVNESGLPDKNRVGLDASDRK